jgi:YVTN family beta-propeller protein
LFAFFYFHGKQAVTPALSRNNQKEQAMYLKTALISMLAVLAGIVPSFVNAAPAKVSYELSETLPLPGPVKWDLLTFDAPNHHLFITRSDRVDILDTNSKKVVASISNLSGVHGVGLAPDANKGFISEGQANRVTVFDLTTLKPIATIPTGKKPDAVIYERETGHIFVADADSNDLTVINAKTNEIAGTIRLDGAPEFAVANGDNKLYINLEDKSWIDVVDTRNLKVIDHYDLTPACEGPTGLALDKADNVLFSVCANKHMVIVDALNGKIKDTLDIGAHPDAAAYDAASGLAFSSNGGDGSLTVVTKAANGHYKILQSVSTKVSARTMALNPDTHEIYLSAGETEGFDPPTAQHPEPRPHVKPDTFEILRVIPAGQPDQTDH